MRRFNERDMAVYTEVSDDALRAFLALYEIGDVISFKGIAEGVENSNFLMRTVGGQFILTLYEKRVKAEDLPFFIGLMEHLAQRGVTCPQPVRNRAGAALGELAGRPATIVTFLDGLWIRRPSVRHCGEVGEALARMHLAGADFPLKRANALSLEGWPIPVPRRGSARGRSRSSLARGERDGAGLSCGASGRRACRAASFTPIFSTTTCSFSARRFPASSTSISPATTRSPTIWRSASAPGASNPTTRSTSPRGGR